MVKNIRCHIIRSLLAILSTVLCFISVFIQSTLYDSYTFCLLMTQRMIYTMAASFIFFLLSSHPCIPPPLSPLLHPCTFILFFSDWSNICSSWALACLFSRVCFQQWSGLCGGSTVPSQTSQCLAFNGWGTEAGPGSGLLSVSATLAALPSLGKLGPASLTHCGHSLSPAHTG